ncbi:transaldolase, partial [Pseudomonas sp. BGM005]|nr:transaldolase [Pseudomonas sp. BG5]
ELVDRGRAWRELSDRVVIKVAYSPDGIAAARLLALEGEVLVTALHRADQILPVALTGATYAAAFIARMDAAGRDGIGEAVSMQRAIDATGCPLRLLAGSLRTPAQILALARAGVSHVTFAPEVWDGFFDDPATGAATDAFA